MNGNFLKVEVVGSVAEVWLSEPQTLNALTPRFFAELAAITVELERRSEARCLIVAGAGKHFCAGMALDVFADADFAPDTTPEQRWNMGRRVRDLQEPFNALERLAIPTIAVVQKACVGGGLDLVAACDMRIATEDSFFQIQETNVAMMADLGTLQRLPKLISPAKVRELAFTGRRWNATEALSDGFVSSLHSTHEAAIDAARQMARTICGRSPVAVAATKAAIRHAVDHGVEDSLNHAAVLQSSVWNSGLVQKAAKAVRAKETLEYRGMEVYKPLTALMETSVAAPPTSKSSR